MAYIGFKVPPEVICSNRHPVRHCVMYKRQRLSTKVWLTLSTITDEQKKALRYVPATPLLSHDQSSMVLYTWKVQSYGGQVLCVIVPNCGRERSPGYIGRIFSARSDRHSPRLLL